MSIGLLINYSRSGGTILSKCLASLDNVVLISEVHPLGSAVKNIKQQAAEWYDIKIKSDDYLEAILELHQICEINNKKLIIRDWTFLDFTPYKLNNLKPNQEFTALDLLKEKVDINAIAFVRDAIDIWISRWKPPRFFDYYKIYVNKLCEREIPILKYESFCENPEKIIKEICNHWNITFSNSYMNYLDQEKVTGDNTTRHLSRGVKLETIQVLKRKKIAKQEQQWLQKNKQMQESNVLLNYSTDYSAKACERGSAFKLELNYWVKKMLGRGAKDLY